MVTLAAQPRLARRTSLRSPIAPRRSDAEIAAIRRAGVVVRAALDAAADACRPGATTESVNLAAARVLGEWGASALFRQERNDRGDVFPGDICISIDEEVLHGAPGRRRVAEGDLVTIDCGASLDGWCADAAITVLVGDVSAERRRLAAVADRILALAMSLMRPGRAWSDVALRLADEAIEHGVHLVGGFAGHGVGRRLHEAPSAPCVVDASFLRWSDFTLLPGMVLAIEPIVTLHPADLRLQDDGWTVVTADGSPAVHVEHTVVITRRGAEIVTGRDARTVGGARGPRGPGDPVGTYLYG
jgi:methionyl aminopeptidase